MTFWLLPWFLLLLGLRFRRKLFRRWELFGWLLGFSLLLVEAPVWLPLLLLLLPALLLLRQARRELAENRQKLHGLLARLVLEHQQDLPPTELLIVMPALREAENLRSLLPQVPREILVRNRTLPPLEVPEAPLTAKEHWKSALPGRMIAVPVRVLVVDDGSDDETAAVAEGLGALVLRSPLTMGGGHALRLGYAMAGRLGARYVVTMDADGQHRFEDLPNLLQPLMEDRADMVVGSRNLGASVGHSQFRALGLRLYNVCLSFLLGRRITDCSSGFRSFRLNSLLKLPLRQDRHHTAETLLAASGAGLRVLEVPIVILPRVHGESKKGADWRYGLRFGKSMVEGWLDLL